MAESSTFKHKTFGGAKMTSDEKLWSDFKIKYWEKKPLVIKNSRQLPLPSLTSDELFQAVVRMMDRIRSTNYTNAFSVRLYLDGTQVQLTSKLDSILPSREDKSFSNYHKRIQKFKKIFKEYGFVIARIHTFETEIWEQSCLIFKPLFTQIGLSRYAFESTVLFGNYRQTPFGVHTDRCGVFHMPVEGIKKMRIWTPQFGVKNPTINKAINYKNFLSGSKLLTAMPGEVIYWPSDRWHIGESTGEFSATWGFGYWFGGVGQNYLQKALVEQIEKKLEYSSSITTVPFSKGDLCRTAQKEVWIARDEYKTFKSLIDSEELKLAHDRKWLEQISGYGFTDVPKIKCGRFLLARDSIKVAAEFPLVWLLRQDGICIVSCRGHSFWQAKGGKWLRLIKLLNTNKVFKISELISRFSNDKISARHFLSFLRSIDKIGGFKKVQYQIRSTEKN